MACGSGSLDDVCYFNTQANPLWAPHLSWFSVLFSSDRSDMDLSPDPSTHLDVSHDAWIRPLRALWP